jgi:hypothetical protein
MKLNHIRAAGGTAFAGALLGTTLASGALALQDPGTPVEGAHVSSFGTMAEGSSTNALERRLEMSRGANKPGPPSYRSNDSVRHDAEPVTKRAPNPPVTTLALEDNALEAVQVGAGVLGGIALAGAAVLARGRRRHAHAAHPA